MTRFSAPLAELARRAGLGDPLPTGVDRLFERRAGYGLAREHYFDPYLFELEKEAIWRSGWLFVAHSCELSRPGDYVALDVLNDPIVVVRQRDGSVRALHNVCRHRGSVVVTDERGHHAALVCPYHQWSYDLDGRLLRCEGAPEGFDRSRSSLGAIGCIEVAGLIYIALSPDAPPADTFVGEFTAAGAIQGLEHAKVAARLTYTIHANWKLVWENNRECFHCAANHPQYIRANFDRYLEGQHDKQDELARALEKIAPSLVGTRDALGMTEFPDAAGTRWWLANRTPLAEGFLTESVSGALVAPMMGEYADTNVGTLRLRSLPNFWCHASCDHAVTTMLLPTALGETRATVTWLVRGDAEEGRDYHPDELRAFWQLTSEQDWEICARQQRGITSSAYVPGPLSSTREANVDAFLTWYANRIAHAVSKSPAFATPGMLES